MNFKYFCFILIISENNYVATCPNIFSIVRQSFTSFYLLYLYKTKTLCYLNSLPAVKSIHYYNFSVLFYEINYLNKIISIKDDAYLFFGNIDIGILSLPSLSFLCFSLYFTVYTFISIFYRKYFKNN